MDTVLTGASLDRSWIEAHVPHRGAMCLLSRVCAWDHTHIECEALGHCDPHHPLRDGGRLGAAEGVEYAAQAMAVHGALLAPAEGTPQTGYLTSVRGLTLFVDRLDDLDGPLWVRAERLSGDARVILYRISVHHHERCLLQGRASVVIDLTSS